MFSSRNFMLSNPSSESLIHLILFTVWKIVQFNYFACSCPGPQHRLLKRIFISHCIFLHSLSQNDWTCECGFIFVLCVLLHWFMCLFLCQKNIVLIILHAFLVAQLCSALCIPMYCRPPGSSIHGIFQTEILQWVAIYLFFFFFCHLSL